jgi:hypothetical protein
LRVHPSTYRDIVVAKYESFVFLMKCDDDVLKPNCFDGIEKVDALLSMSDEEFENRFVLAKSTRVYCLRFGS